MRCAYCNSDCGPDRPVSIQAVCWRCWYEMYGKAQAVREWKARRWWRRLVPWGKRDRRRRGYSAEHGKDSIRSTPPQGGTGSSGAAARGEEVDHANP